MQASCFCMLLCASSLSFATSFADQVGLKSSLKYFPVGPIYEYRWKLLELALAHTRDEAASVRLEPFAE